MLSRVPIPSHPTPSHVAVGGVERKLTATMLMAIQIKALLDSFKIRPADSSMVVSIPAHFTSAQVMDMRSAMLMAGIDEGQIRTMVQEPTSIALSVVCVDKLITLPNDGVESNILVVDIGGGTSDLSAVQMYHQVSPVTDKGVVHARVKGTSGDNFLGMTTIRDTLVTAYLDLVSSKGSDVSATARSAAVVAVDTALRRLCDSTGGEMAVLGLLDAVGQQVDAEVDVEVAADLPKVTVSLAQIRQSCGAALDAVAKLVAKAIEAPGWSSTGPHYVVLAGGTCRLLPVREAVVRGIRGLPRAGSWDTKVVVLGADQATTQVAKGNAFIAATLSGIRMDNPLFNEVFFEDRTTTDLRVKVLDVDGRQCLEVVMPSGSPLNEFFPSKGQLETNFQLPEYSNSTNLTISHLCMNHTTGSCRFRAEGKECTRCRGNIFYDFYECNHSKVSEGTVCGKLKLLVSKSMLDNYTGTRGCMGIEANRMTFMFQAQKTSSGLADIRIWLVTG